MYRRTAFGMCVLLTLILTAATAAHAQAVRDPERTQGLIAPAPAGVHDLITLDGPGKFISAQVTKQGGASDLTSVILDIDGRNVVNLTFAALRNIGLTQSNPYGLVLLNSAGDPETLTVGFPYPLTYKQELKLSVSVSEEGVAQVVANVVHGR